MRIARLIHARTDHACAALMAGLFLLLGGGFANADQGITGKKLLLKSNPKMVLLSKDGLLIPGALGSFSDPRCVLDGGSGLGASVKLDDGINSATLSMPCANWSANSGGTLYKYKDATGTPKVGKLKAGLLKVVSPGMNGFPVPTGAATVNVEVTVGLDKYCMTFAGNGDGSKFLVKDATTGTCVVAQTCGNDIQEGTEECDGTDITTPCPSWCQVDCTCPPPSTCGGSFPTCGGSCSSGFCTNVGTFCGCIAFGACGTHPTCGGSCPAGYGCIAVALPGPNCACVAPPP